jgi:DNA-binding response OmpR family regulator
MSRVLVVEDEALPGLEIESALEADVDVVMTGSGAKALQLALKGTFDCIVLDLGLPDITGLEVLRSLRRLRETLPVVVLTGFRGPEIRDAAKHAGANAYFEKPVDMRVLAMCVRLLAACPPQELPRITDRLWPCAWVQHFVRSEICVAP